MWAQAISGCVPLGSGLGLGQGAPEVCGPSLSAVGPAGQADPRGSDSARLGWALALAGHGPSTAQEWPRHGSPAAGSRAAAHRSYAAGEVWPSV